MCRGKTSADKAGSVECDDGMVGQQVAVSFVVTFCSLRAALQYIVLLLFVKLLYGVCGM